ncbi:GNAT family N-acetyltransferase [Bailinhaonella thermotolerans]|uniref:N-acetyltransferase n=1 Tax=Bailinhaonella thermotolerans TaxID=1070861 RepID=A0A3A4BDF3_9ACTN|nr:GNAT family N-acetyltransferase [Bailinhaonella thermotolerans]RJL36126.1 N-acetyltransferase [Bailinhaonella thermotolerans]
MRLRTERLSLRPVTPGDAGALREHWGDPAVREHLFDGEPVTEALAAELVAASERDFREAGYGLWAVFGAPEPGSGGPPGWDGPAGEAGPAGEDGGLVGVCGLRADDGGEAELVYSLAPRSRGRGLAAEATRAVLGHAFGSAGLKRVVAEVDPGNAPSAALAVRLGMAPVPDAPGPYLRFVLEAPGA